MSIELTKRYNKPCKASSPRSVKKFQKGEKYEVNRFLLRMKMLERGVETYAELNKLLGYRDSNRASVSRLVRGKKWYPGLARKIERFLGVKEGEIFRRIEGGKK